MPGPDFAGDPSLPAAHWGGCTTIAPKKGSCYTSYASTLIDSKVAHHKLQIHMDNFILS